MQSTRPEISPVKAGRRVLGEKNTNASLTPSATRYTDKLKPSTDAIPFKTLKESSREDVSHHAGQKRTIEQVTDSEVEDVEPRKAVVVTSEPGSERDFQIFDDNNTRPNSSSREITPGVTAQASEQLIPSQRQKSLPERESEESSTSIPASSVPTEPAARRIFIQEKAALVRQRLQSAMHRVGNNSLDRALSQFEASSRPLVPRGNAVSSSSNRISLSPSFIAAATKPTAAATVSQTSPKQKRVLLPPLPIQPQSRPVRASARTSIPSPFSESASNIITPQEELEEVGKVAEEDEDNNEEEDDEETPKAQIENRQRFETNVEQMRAALDEANALNKLKELAQSSTNAEQTVGR